MSDTEVQRALRVLERHGLLPGACAVVQCPTCQGHGARWLVSPGTFGERVPTRCPRCQAMGFLRVVIADLVQIEPVQLEPWSPDWSPDSLPDEPIGPPEAADAPSWPPGGGSS